MARRQGADCSRLYKIVYGYLAIQHGPKGTTVLPRVRLNSETARREFLVASVLLEIARRYDVLCTEFALNVSEQLRGSLDYLVQGTTQFLVIEAKNDDMACGMSQLVAEMAL
jgi:hypothetical protein